MKRLVFLIGNEGTVLCFICMRNNQFIRRNERKPPCLEITFLCEREQMPEEFLIAFQHLLELHHPPVRLIQLPVKPVGPRVRL
ncbi:Uncharacterised protein [Mycobacteroides abscessus subsp. abscessus]|nr:Uncharacterised protein [Mycobacteroides abscessus subsp. abscessus]